MRASIAEQLLTEDTRHTSVRSALLEDLGRHPNMGLTPQQRLDVLVRGIRNAATAFGGHIAGWSNFSPRPITRSAGELSVRFFVQEDSSDAPGDVAAHWITPLSRSLPPTANEIRQGTRGVLEVEYLSVADLPTTYPEGALTPQDVAQDAGAVALRNLAQLEQTLQAVRGFRG